MQIIETVDNLKILLNKFKNNTIGFVPTMGALHAGHASLIKKSKMENDITIVSVFVNKRQFNDQNDYVNYPRTIENDIELLNSLSCNILFFPENNDIYKNYEGCKIDFQGLDKIYEGEFRPGHFQGVVDIVYRFFQIINPTNAYFGAKDFQQLAIIKLMTKQMNLKTNIIACEILREKSGLAMSSRNKRLQKDELEQAPNIYKIITQFSKNINKSDKPSIIINDITKAIDKNSLLKTEYIVFCDENSLKTIDSFKESKNIRLCIAVWCGEIRLIDNLRL
ncbi:MAG: pantoate--beta-alanine ligase [Bacteroidales bacterium]|jgi:pantoate--beta-alanine ligase|nr:pantoate--beta-alanine ligase [Bacteroidales bacterium]